MLMCVLFYVGAAFVAGYLVVHHALGLSERFR
jgi:hypothetical protein